MNDLVHMNLHNCPGLRVKVGHIWFVLILFSSSKKMKMYTNSCSNLASSLCEDYFLNAIFMPYIGRCTVCRFFTTKTGSTWISNFEKETDEYCDIGFLLETSTKYCVYNSMINSFMATDLKDLLICCEYKTTVGSCSSSNVDRVTNK
jgi:hypothetical protein